MKNERNRKKQTCLICSRKAILGFILFLILLIVVSLIQYNDQINCEDIEILNERDDCYVNLAKQTGNRDVCDSITTSVHFKDECLRVVAVKQKDIEVCEDIVYSNSKSYCYESIAEVNKDPSICPTVEQDKWEQTCYHKLALILEDFTLCSELDAWVRRDECYQGVAEKTEDHTICLAIPSKDNANACLWEIAKSTQNEKICESWIVTDTGDKIKKDLCYKNLARRKQNNMICNGIVSNSVRKECLDMFNN